MDEATPDAWERGPVVCMVCLHEWDAVRPVAALVLVCPRCDHVAGVREFTIIPPIGEDEAA